MKLVSIAKAATALLRALNKRTATVAPNARSIPKISTLAPLVFSDATLHWPFDAELQRQRSSRWLPNCAKPKFCEA